MAKAASRASFGPPRKSRGRRPSRAIRSPRALVKEPIIVPPLPPNAASWMHRGQRLALAIARAIEDGHADDSTRAAIERAFSAFELGFTDRDIARVAHVVERAYDVIRETRRSALDGAYVDAASVLRRTVPAGVRRGTSFDVFVQVVRELASEANSELAITGAVARLLGWPDVASSHAREAVRIARGLR